MKVFSSHGGRTARCSSFSPCGAPALGFPGFSNCEMPAQWLQLPSSRTQAQESWFTGFIPPQHVGASRTRNRTHISGIGRQTLYHWANRETLFSSVQSLTRVRVFATPWTATRQASLSITNSRSLFKVMSIESVMPSNQFTFGHYLSGRSIEQQLMTWLSDWTELIFNQYLSVFSWTGNPSMVPSMGLQSWTQLTHWTELIFSWTNGILK